MKKLRENIEFGLMMSACAIAFYLLYWQLDFMFVAMAKGGG